jgi:hypothetical protein
MDKESWYKKMYELKKSECNLFERKWIEYRNFLLTLHFTLDNDNPLKKKIEEFTKDDIRWEK